MFSFDELIKKLRQIESADFNFKTLRQYNINPDLLADQIEDQDLQDALTAALIRILPGENMYVDPLDYMTVQTPVLFVSTEQIYCKIYDIRTIVPHLIMYGTDPSTGASASLENLYNLGATYEALCDAFFRANPILLRESAETRFYKDIDVIQLINELIANLLKSKASTSPIVLSTNDLFTAAKNLSPINNGPITPSMKTVRPILAAGVTTSAASTSATNIIEVREKFDAFTSADEVFQIDDSSPIYAIIKLIKQGCVNKLKHDFKGILSDEPVIISAQLSLIKKSFSIDVNDLNLINDIFYSIISFVPKENFTGESYKAMLQIVLVITNALVRNNISGAVLKLIDRWGLTGSIPIIILNVDASLAKAISNFWAHKENFQLLISFFETRLEAEASTILPEGFDLTTPEALRSFKNFLAIWVINDRDCFLSSWYKGKTIKDLVKEFNQIISLYRENPNPRFASSVNLLASIIRRYIGADYPEQYSYNVLRLYLIRLFRGNNVCNMHFGFILKYSGTTDSIRINNIVKKIINDFKEIYLQMKPNNTRELTAASFELVATMTNGDSLANSSSSAVAISIENNAEADVSTTDNIKDANPNEVVLNLSMNVETIIPEQINWRNFLLQISQQQFYDICSRTLGISIDNAWQVVQMTWKITPNINTLMQKIMKLSRHRLTVEETTRCVLSFFYTCYRVIKNEELSIESSIKEILNRAFRNTIFDLNIKTDAVAITAAHELFSHLKQIADMPLIQEPIRNRCIVLSTDRGQQGNDLRRGLIERLADSHNFEVNTGNPADGQFYLLNRKRIIETSIYDSTDIEEFCSNNDKNIAIILINEDRIVPTEAIRTKVEDYRRHNPKGAIILVLQLIPGVWAHWTESKKTAELFNLKWFQFEPSDPSSSEGLANLIVETCSQQLDLQASSSASFFRSIIGATSRFFWRSSSATPLSASNRPSNRPAPELKR